MRYTHQHQLVYTVLLWLPLIVIWLIPYDYFDKGPEVCPSVVLFNQKCAGCGLTRSIMRVFHFRFQEAIQFNKYVFLWLFPIIVLYFPELLVSTIKTIKKVKYYPLDILNLLIQMKIKISRVALVLSILSLIIGIGTLLFFILYKLGHLKLN